MTVEFELDRTTSPQHCFNALFMTMEAARMAGSIRANDRFIRDLKPLDENTWETTAAYFIDGPYTDDLSIALVRIFLLTNRHRLYGRLVASMLAHSKSYLFLMELGLLLGRFEHFSLARTAYETARCHAVNSSIKMDPFDKDIPHIGWGSDIILPHPAVVLCDYVSMRAERGAQSPSNYNLFDYRVYLPSGNIVGFKDGAKRLKLTLAMALLVLRHIDEPDDVVWCCEVEDWMADDKLPAEIEAKSDLAIELGKRYYLDLPKLIASLIHKNQQLTQETESLKQALQND
jgi:hypothetical protein